MEEARGQVGRARTARWLAWAKANDVVNLECERSLVRLFHGTGARLRLTNVSSRRFRLCYRVVQGRQPALASASVPLLHLHAADPERGILRRLAFNACNGKVLGVHPDPAANRKLGRLLGIDLQNIAGPATRSRPLWRLCRSDDFFPAGSV
jgi:hypothetical protein